MATARSAKPAPSAAGSVNSIWDITSKPFDVSVVKKNYANFDYVPWGEYEKRLNEACPNGQDIKVIITHIAKTGYICSVTGTVINDDARYKRTRPFFKKFIIDKDSKEIVQTQETIAAIYSEGVKAFGRSLGMHVPNEERDGEGATDGIAGGASTASRSSRPAAATNPNAKSGGTGSSDPFYDPNWDGEEGIPFKIKTTPKGTPYADIDEGQLGWLCTKKHRDTGKPEPDPGALKERARRAAENEGGSSADDEPLDDGEIPF